MMRALVTGSTGGVGANLVAVLNRRGIEVVGLRRSTSSNVALDGMQVIPVVGDVLDPESLQRAMEGVDWVFHAAAIADDWHFPASLVYRVNVEGTRNVLAAALSAGVRRVVFTSSAAALGKPLPDKPLMDEQNQFNLAPRDWAYGHSKHLAEQVAVEFAGQGLPVVIVQPTAIMGPCDVKFISGELIVRALKGEIFPFPDGGLNFIDSRDCAQAHLAAAESGRPGERYLLAGHNLTHRETLATIGEVLGVPIRYVRVPRGVLRPLAEIVGLLGRLGVNLPIERGRVLLSGHYMYYDNRKAVRELGLNARPFAESVQDAYRWYLDHDYLAQRGVKAARRT